MTPQQALDLAHDRPSACDDDLYDWSVDAENALRLMADRLMVAEELAAQYAAEAAHDAAQAVPAVRVADVGFRWDGEKQQHVPTLLVEFEPVPANSGSDAKGWRDRDAIAAMLAAAAPAPQAQAAGQEPPPLPEPDGTVEIDCGPAPGGGREIVFKDGYSADQMHAYARAALAARPAVPAGFVLVPVEVLEDAATAIGHFVSDHGWSDEDMQAMDNLDAYIARHKANAAPATPGPAPAEQAQAGDRAMASDWSWTGVRMELEASGRDDLSAWVSQQIEPKAHAGEPVGLTDEQIAEGRYRTWAAEPEDAPEAWSFLRGARWAESALAVRWGVKLGATTGEQQR